MFLRVYDIQNTSGSPIDLGDGLIIGAGLTATPNNQWWTGNGWGLAGRNPLLNLILSNNTTIASGTDAAYELCAETGNYYSGYFDLFSDIQTLSTSTNLVIGSDTFGTQGAQGSTGAQGNTGSQGNQGFQGSQGFQGTTGSQGTQGAQGSIGPQGNQGNQGLPYQISASGSSDAISTTSSTTYQNKLTVNFTPSVTKTYCMRWSCEMANNNANGNNKLRADGSFTITGDLLVKPSVVIANSYVPYSGIGLVALTAGTPYTFTIDYAASSMTAAIRNARIVIN
jgi:hypothetical protein